MGEGPQVMCKVPNVLALLVGWMRAAEVGAFLPVNAKLLEIVLSGLRKVRATASLIDIFIAVNQGAVGFEATLVCDPEGASVAEVEQACGGRGNAATV